MFKLFSFEGVFGLFLFFGLFVCLLLLIAIFVCLLVRLVGWLVLSFLFYFWWGGE